MSVNRPFKTAYVQLKDPKVDCPDPMCEGWLCLYGTVRDRTPIFVACSYKNARQNKCNQNVIFSKRESICSACSKVINLKDVITTRRFDGTWIHLACAFKEENQPCWGKDRPTFPRSCGRRGSRIVYSGALSVVGGPL
jgi:hypothetical protein